MTRVFFIPEESVSLVHFHDLTSHVGAALGADDMGGDSRITLGTNRAFDRFFMIVRPPGTGSRVAVFTFGDRHDRKGS